MSNLLAAGLVKRALLAAANGPFFPEWEFPTLFGVSREKMTSAVDQVGDSASATGELPRRAAAGAVNNLLGYPHGQEALVVEWLAAPLSELEAAFREWQGENGA